MFLEQTRREEARWQLLRLLDIARPEALTHALLRRSLKDMHITLTDDELRSELDYLQGKALIAIAPTVRAYCLTADGVDVMEANAPAPTGVALGELLSDLELTRRRDARWRILKVLDAGRPVAVSKTLLRTALDDQSLMLSNKEMDREIQYLQERGYCLVEDDRGQLLKLTSEAIDLLEYNVDCPRSIGRPPKYDEVY